MVLGGVLVLWKKLGDCVPLAWNWFCSLGLGLCDHSM